MHEDLLVKWTNSYIQNTMLHNSNRKDNYIFYDQQKQPFNLHFQIIHLFFNTLWHWSFDNFIPFTLTINYVVFEKNIMITCFCCWVCVAVNLLHWFSNSFILSGRQLHSQLSFHFRLTLPFIKSTGLSKPLLPFLISHSHKGGINQSHLYSKRIWFY